MVYSSLNRNLYPWNSAYNPIEKGLMADIKNVYKVAGEMGNSSAMVKNIIFRLWQKLRQLGFGILDQTELAQRT